MNTLSQQLADESLNKALNRLEREIKSRPADADLRAAFVQFLLLDGNWSRALTQLKSWQALTPQAKPTVTLLEQAINGEQQRAQVMAGQVPPAMPDNTTPWLNMQAKALTLTGEEAQALRLAALEQAPASAGQLSLDNDTSHTFSWLMDGDGRLGPVCEVIVNGHYFWLPFSVISEIRFQPPTCAADLVWRHALIALQDGTEQVCQLPVRYPFAPEAADAIKLGRTTQWHPLNQDNTNTLYEGQGQKVWFSDENENSLLSLSVVTFTTDDSDE